METRVLTIMMTDIQGFTERTSSTSRAALDELLAEHEELLLPVVRHFKGTLIKTIGDALLVTFESPTNAVLCGLMIQERLKLRNTESGDAEQLNIRVAINTGEVQLRDGDIFGEPVNIVARIEGITDAGEIFFTEAVYLAMNKSEVPSSEVGHHRLKGIPEAIKVYKVIQDAHSTQYQSLLKRLRSEDIMALNASSDSDGAPHVLLQQKKMRRRWIGGIAAGIGIIVVAMTILYDPVARESQRIMEALANNNPEEAMAIATALAPQAADDERIVRSIRAVVTYEIDAHIKRKNFSGGLEHVDAREKRFTFLQLDDLRKKLLIARAAELVSRDQIAASLDTYAILLERHAGRDTWLEIMQRIGSQDYPQPLAIRAALAYSENTTGLLDELPGSVLLKSLKYRGAFGKLSMKIRGVLIKRYPVSIKTSRKYLHDNDYEHRVNSYLLLKEAKALSEHEALRYHFYTLMELGGGNTYRKVIEETREYFNNFSKRKDWFARKQAAGLVTPEYPASLRSFGAYKTDDARLLLKLFMPEIEPVLRRYIDSDISAQRVNAWYMLRSAGLSKSLDADAFHAKSLTTFDPRYAPEYFRDAVEYFRKRATSKPAIARKALLAGVVHVRRTVNEYKGLRASGWVATLRKNLKLVRKTLRNIR